MCLYMNSTIFLHCVFGLGGGEEFENRESTPALFPLSLSLSLSLTHTHTRTHTRTHTDIHSL